MWTVIEANSYANRYWLQDAKNPSIAYFEASKDVACQVFQKTYGVSPFDKEASEEEGVSDLFDVRSGFKTLEKAAKSTGMGDGLKLVCFQAETGRAADPSERVIHQVYVPRALVQRSDKIKQFLPLSMQDIKKNWFAVDALEIYHTLEQHCARKDVAVFYAKDVKKAGFNNCPHCGQLMPKK